MPEKASDHYIMPYQTCTDDWCFWDANGGAVPPGERFLDYGNCAVVRTQGMPWTSPVHPPSTSDPRLEDPAFVEELAWVTEQVEATACSCCHDSDSTSASVFDFSQGPVWISSMTNRGVMMGAGIVNTDVLGAFAPEDNHGYDRYTSVFPTTDVERLTRFFLNELEYREVPQEEIDSVPPLTGPQAENRDRETTPCDPGVGVDSQGAIHWNVGGARYAWVMETTAVNPGSPANLHLPEGTLWHGLVHHEDPALESGQFMVSTDPAGARQLYPDPATTEAPALVEGQEYKLSLMRDHGFPLKANCIFTYPIEPVAG